MQKSSFWKVGHTPTLLAAFFYFDLSFMVWVILGPLGVQISKDLGQTAAQKGLVVATPLLAGALLRIVMGVLVDHLKPKKAGIIGQVIVMCGMVWAWQGNLHSYESLLFLGVILGVAGAAFAVVALTASEAVQAREAPKLGTPITAEDAAKWDLSVFPDGKGLPPGRGAAADGKVIFENQCASCHGDGGRGATAEELVTEPQPLTGEAASKAIGTYWPYATTIFDFVRRSMPAGAPGSLSADDVYAVTAYLLAANKVIAETDEMNAKTLPAVKMPNRDGFDWIDVKK